MTDTQVTFVLSHKGGASDAIWASCDVPIPHKGEYVTIGDVVHGYVFDVNYDFGVEGEKNEAKVYLACRGKSDYCEWDCDSDYVDELRS